MNDQFDGGYVVVVIIFHQIYIQYSQKKKFVKLKIQFLVFQKEESIVVFRALSMSLRFQSSAKQMLNPSKSIFAQKGWQSFAFADTEKL